MSTNPDIEEGYDAENLVAGEQMNEDEEHQEPFLPPTRKSIPSGRRIIIHESRPVGMGTNQA